MIPIWAALAGTPPLGVIIAVAFAIGSLRAFVDAAAFGAVAAVVGPQHFTGGQAVLSASWSIGLLTGPSLGGALIGFVGPSWTIAVQAATFALATVAILLVRRDIDGGRTPHVGRIRDGVTEGVRYLLGDPLLRVLTATGVVWNVASAGSIALIVPLLRRDIGLGSEQAGIVLAVGAAMGSSRRRWSTRSSAACTAGASTSCSCSRARRRSPRSGSPTASSPRSSRTPRRAS